MPWRTRRRLLWVLANVAGAVAVPLGFAGWLQRELRSGGTLPEEFSPSVVVLAVTAGWALFLLLLNVSLALFLWLRGR